MSGRGALVAVFGWGLVDGAEALAGAAGAEVGSEEEDQGVAECYADDGAEEEAAGSGQGAFSTGIRVTAGTITQKRVGFNAVAVLNFGHMDARRFAGVLGPIALAVLIGGWALAVVAFFVIGTETCTALNLGIAGRAQVCQDTTAGAVILLTVIGFAATVGSMFLLALRFMLLVLDDIKTNTGR